MVVKEAWRPCGRVDDTEMQDYLESTKPTEQRNTRHHFRVLSLMYRGQRDDSVVQSTCCSSREREFIHIRELTTPVTPAPRDPM